MQTDLWKLDTVINQLITVWTSSTPAVKPPQQLEGIAFFTAKNVGYQGLDFSGVQLSGSGFYGPCDLTGAKFDSPEVRKQVDHCGNIE